MSVVQRILFSAFWVVLPSGYASALAVPDSPEVRAQCRPPDFWYQGKCWTEIDQHQDCRVRPLVMELEDRPVYCPKPEVIPLDRLNLE